MGQAARELLRPPTFGLTEVEVVQETFVREFDFGGEGAGPDGLARPYLPRELDALRRKLTEKTMIRLVGLACHLLYWTVLRPMAEADGPGAPAAEGPSEDEKATLYVSARESLP